MNASEFRKSGALAFNKYNVKNDRFLGQPKSRKNKYLFWRF